MLTCIRPAICLAGQDGILRTKHVGGMTQPAGGVDTLADALDLALSSGPSETLIIRFGDMIASGSCACISGPQRDGAAH